MIAQVGVAGTSHRKVAETADVPLGSMTYHFSGMTELLHEAFNRFADIFSERFADRLAGSADRDAAIHAVVDAVLVDILTDTRELVLTHELYTLAARNPSFRDITHSWMARSRTALERHFDPGTAGMLEP